MNDDKLMKTSAVVLVFAGLLVVLGSVLAGTPMGRVRPSENTGMWLAVIVGGLLLTFALTVFVMRIGNAVIRRLTPAQTAKTTTVNATTPAAQPQPVRPPAARTRTYNYEELQW